MRKLLLLVLLALPCSAAYTYQTALTMDSCLAVSADQTDFPCAERITDTRFKTVANGGHVQGTTTCCAATVTVPADFNVYANSGCSGPLKWHMEMKVGSMYDGNTNYSFTLWVKIPTLSHATAPTVFLCYGDSTVTTFQGDENGTADSNMYAWYHLADVTQGATDATNAGGFDSTSHTNHALQGTSGIPFPTSDPTCGSSGSGCMHLGVEGRNSLKQRLSFNDHPANFSFSGDFTISMLVDYWSGPCSTFTNCAWMAKDVASGTNNKWIFGYETSSSRMLFHIQNTGLSQNVVIYQSGTTSIAGAGAHWVAVTRSGNTFTFYHNGVSVGSASNSSTIPAFNMTTWIGYSEGGGADTLYANVDEDQVSDGVARDANYIQTGYNNLTAQTTYTLGSEVRLTATRPSRVGFL